MAESDRGWTTEWPVVNGIYWARWQSTVSVNTFIVEVIGKRFYMTGRSLICPNHETPAPYEWLGPISRSDAEQLVELRRVGQWALDAQVEYNGPCEHEARYADDCLQCQLRAALNPSHSQKEKVTG